MLGGRVFCHSDLDIAPTAVVMMQRPCGAGPGVTPGPRREPIHGGSVATSLSLTVPGAIPRPITEKRPLKHAPVMKECAHLVGIL